MHSTLLLLILIELSFSLEDEIGLLPRVCRATPAGSHDILFACDEYLSFCHAVDECGSDQIRIKFDFVHFVELSLLLLQC